MTFFRLDYHAYLTDGRCFRPNTWIVVDDAASGDEASRALVADTRAEARMWHHAECVVTITRITRVTEEDYRAHCADVRAVIALADADPDAIRREAHRRGVLPTVVAEECKHAAARLRGASPDRLDAASPRRAAGSVIRR